MGLMSKAGIGWGEAVAREEAGSHLKASTRPLVRYPLSGQQRADVLRWLENIGVHDQERQQRVLNIMQNDLAHREAFLDEMNGTEFRTVVPLKPPEHSMADQIAKLRERVALENRQPTRIGPEMS